jgi:hypothetical protein
MLRGQSRTSNFVYAKFDGRFFVWEKSPIERGFVGLSGFRSSVLFDDAIGWHAVLDSFSCVCGQPSPKDFTRTILWHLDFDFL